MTDGTNDTITNSDKTTEAITITRTSTLTNASDGTTVGTETSEVVPQCVLHPDILKTMCTSMVMKNVTVEEAGVNMRSEMLNILENLFQHCDTRTFTVKIDFTLEF